MLAVVLPISLYSGFNNVVLLTTFSIKFRSQASAVSGSVRSYSVPPSTVAHLRNARSVDVRVRLAAGANALLQRPGISGVARSPGLAPLEFGPPRHGLRGGRFRTSPCWSVRKRVKEFPR